MGAARRRGTLADRIAQATQRSTAELEARQRADVELARARRAASPEEAERYLAAGLRHRRSAALIAMLGAVAVGGRR